MTFVGLSATLGALVLVIASGHAVVRLCGFSSWPERVAAGILVAAAQAVAIAELLSLVHGFRLSAALPALAASSAAAVWFSNRRAAYGPPEVAARVRVVRAAVVGIWQEIESSRAAVLAAVLLLAVLTTEFVLAVGVAPNGFDALAYHLTRAAMWLQFHSIAQFPGATERQAVFPINAEVLQSWAMMLARGDRTVQLVQWTAGLGSLALVGACTRRLGFSRRDAVLTTTVAASLPMVVAQSSSAQNDLVFAFFALGVVYFGLLAVRDNSTPAAIFTGIAFALAVGTKSVALPMVAAFAVFGLVLCDRDFGRLVAPAVAALVALVLLGSFNYVQNIAKHGSLTAAPSQDTLRVHSPAELPKNAVRTVWAGLFDMPGVSVHALDRTVGSVGNRLFGWAKQNGTYTWFAPVVRHAAREDQVGPGPLGLLVILPALMLGLAAPARRERFALALFSVAVGAVVVATLRYNLWINRFLMAGYLASVPLTAALMGREWARALILGVAVLSALPMLLLSHSKSLLGPNVLTMNRAEQMGFASPRAKGLFLGLAAGLPKSGNVGLIGDEDSLEYQVFGPHFERRVLRLSPADLKAGVMSRFDLDALVVLNRSLAERAVDLGGKTIPPDVFADPRESRGILISPKDAN